MIIQTGNSVNMAMAKAFKNSGFSQEQWIQKAQNSNAALVAAGVSQEILNNTLIPTMSIMSDEVVQVAQTLQTTYLETLNHNILMPLTFDPNQIIESIHTKSYIVSHPALANWVDAGLIDGFHPELAPCYIGGIENNNDYMRVHNGVVTNDYESEGYIEEFYEVHSEWETVGDLETGKSDFEIDSMQQDMLLDIYEKIAYHATNGVDLTRGTLPEASDLYELTDE